MTKHLNENRIQGKFGKHKLQAADLEQKLLEGDITALSMAITLAESTILEKRIRAEAIIEANHNKLESKTWRIGISGVPGSGKSTFIEQLGNLLNGLGKKVAVLAVDPSSNFNHGSILGDKTRMEKLSQSALSFVRPSPSSNHLGGVNDATHQNIQLCEIAGFDVIIVESVGVGQSETELRDLVDFFLLLKVPDTGDDLQGIKRGILECCDAIFINKSDLGGAEKAQSIFNNALHVLQRRKSFWNPRAMPLSALKGNHMQDAYEMISKYFDMAVQSDSLDKLREDQNKKQKLLQFQREAHRFIEQEPKIKKLNNQLNSDEMRLSEVLIQLSRFKIN